MPDYKDLAQLFNGEYKGIQKRKEQANTTIKPYRMAEFTSINDALEFTRVLPKRSGLYISQHGLLVMREGENTDRVGEYAWSNVSELSTPDYIADQETNILSKSNRLFSKISPSVFQVRWRAL